MISPSCCPPRPHEPERPDRHGDPGRPTPTPRPGTRPDLGGRGPPYDAEVAHRAYELAAQVSVRVLLRQALKNRRWAMSRGMPGVTTAAVRDQAHGLCRPERRRGDRRGVQLRRPRLDRMADRNQARRRLPGTVRERVWRAEVKIDVGLRGGDLRAVGGEAASYERLGADGLWSVETAHDPFLPLFRGGARRPGGGHRRRWRRLAPFAAPTTWNSSARAADACGSGFGTRSGPASSAGSRPSSAPRRRGSSTTSAACGRSGTRSRTARGRPTRAGSTASR